ncbi:MAG: aldo/keto reductase [Candidatus Eisenbacteria bacterium]|uniref:Aldo/keto reductase n=1 Tax=Eiseniibacteriota bacterium TaxID=2212470 RepID=A0A956NF72_UNCEI|nr:aldo/keto reductase [Candidatus Eisenbacteria bacterium]
MELTYLGGTGVKVSKLAFGTMSFGGDADEETSGALYRRAREAGINLFDCANVYQWGHSEEILGRLIKGDRDDIVLTTKAYFPMGDDANARGATRRHLVHALDASLRRLGTDRVDVFFVHRFDDDTPLEETLRALDDLVRSGKVLYLGASNYAAWQVAKALGISARHGWSRFEVIQPMYNLVKRQAEVEILPLAASENVGVTPYSPLAGGLLSGKYGISKNPESGRILDNKMYATRYAGDRVREEADRFVAFANERGWSPVALAVAWVASHPAITAPLLGARNVEQLDAGLAAMEIPMTPELRAEVSELTTSPPPATDRNEEATAFNYGKR